MSKEFTKITKTTTRGRDGGRRDKERDSHKEHDAAGPNVHRESIELS